MEAVAIVTMLLVIECFAFSALVGRARVKGGIDAPATVGSDTFNRYFRVHQNTIEQLILVIPAMWVFATYINANVAAGLGLVFGIGRIIYLRGYVDAPKKRGAGFGIGMLATLILILGALGGAVWSWIG